MPMKRSDVLLWILLALVAIIGVLGFTVPQPILDANELLLAGVVMPILGGLWIWWYLAAKSGK